MNIYQCSRCKQNKPEIDFPICRGNKRGRNYYCTECNNKHNIEYKTTNVLKIRAYEKEKYHSDKVIARKTVGYLVRMRKLPRPEMVLCVICKKQHADEYHHHNGYSPLHVVDVIPVCRKCHNAIHFENP
jgi:RecJ-like exonuclease